VRPQGDDGEQGEECGGGAKNRFVGPLALGLDAEMSAGFFERDLDLPAAHEPSEDIARTGVKIGCQERLRFEVAFGIADEEPTDRHRRHAAAIPQRSAAGDLDEAIGSAVPETDAVALPGDFGIVEDGGELFQALAFDRRPAAAFALLRREIEQVGIEAQAGDETDMVADGGEEFDCSEGAIGDQDNVAIGEPAADLQGGLAGPIEQCLGGARFAGIETFGRGEQREEGQRHAAVGPRHAHEQHGRKPAQAAGFDEVSLGGADRIAIDAAGADLGSPAPLDGVIEPDHDRRAGRHEGFDQQDQQPARHRPRRPRCSVEDAVESAEIGIAISSQDAQRRRDGAPAGRQDDAGEQQEDIRPRRAREQIGEPCEPGQQAWRKRIRGDGQTMGVLHPMRRIDALNRGNLARVRQIESTISSVSPVCRPSGTLTRMMKTHPTLAQIAAQFTRHDVEKSGSGYMILDRRTLKPVARLRPIPDTDRFELFYWSNIKGRWRTFGNLGRLKLMLESAHEIVEADPMFRIPRSR
jgi:hypothetical protein